MSDSLPRQEAFPGSDGSSASNLHVWASLLLIALPALAYAGLLAASAVNVPYLDDYDTILRFLVEEREPDAKPLTLLFAQHVEHRLVFLKAVALGMTGITGHVDFVAFAWIGFLGLALLAVGLFAVWRPDEPPRSRLLGFAPVTLLLFQPQFWDAFFWATSSLSNLWVIPLALAALACLSREGTIASASATALAGLAVVTQGNGFLVLPAGLLLLGLQRRAGAAFFWAGASATLVALYSIGFQPVDGSPSLLDTLQRLPTLLHYALNFLGSAAGFSHPVASPLFGGLILCGAAALSMTGFPRKNPVLYALLALLIASAAVNALGRAHISGAEYPLSSTRYRFYASATLAVTYLCWSEWIAGRRPDSRMPRPLSVALGRGGRAFLVTALGLGLVFNLASYRLYTGRAVEVSRQLEGGLHHWRTTRRGLRHPDQRHAGDILSRATGRGIYAPDL